MADPIWQIFAGETAHVSTVRRSERNTKDVAPERYGELLQNKFSKNRAENAETTRRPLLDENERSEKTPSVNLPIFKGSTTDWILFERIFN